MTNGYNQASLRGAHRGGEHRRTRRDETHVPDIDLSGVHFGGTLDAQLFNSIAKRCAETIGANQKRNKPSQLRRFYDELLMWVAKVEQRPKRFDE